MNLKSNDVTSPGTIVLSLAHLRAIYELPVIDLKFIHVNIIFFNAQKAINFNLHKNKRHTIRQCISN